MSSAIELAENGVGQTSPNPAVGAVIVHDGRIVAEGYHVKAGTLHAERVAISEAEEKGFNDWSEATLYCTLEPCSTHGSTGACSEAILQKGFKKVVYGSTDPNPAHAGRADGLFQRAGIEVSSGVCEEGCSHVIRGFKKAQKSELPWVIIKSAMSLDGKITRPPSEGQWLTSQKSRETVHRLRAEVDAIITGGNTVRIDNPSLTVRVAGRCSSLRQPRRVVFTRERASLPVEAEIIKDSTTLIYETQTDEDLKVALKDLCAKGVNTVLVEAGGGLLGAFIDADLVDEVVVYFAPLLTGGEASGVSGKGKSTINDALKLASVRYEKLGNDVMMRGEVIKEKS